MNNKVVRSISAGVLCLMMVFTLAFSSTEVLADESQNLMVGVFIKAYQKSNDNTSYYKYEDTIKDGSGVAPTNIVINDLPEDATDEQIIAKVNERLGNPGNPSDSMRFVRWDTTIETLSYTSPVIKRVNATAIYTGNGEGLYNVSVNYTNNVGIPDDGHQTGLIDCSNYSSENAIEKHLTEEIEKGFNASDSMMDDATETEGMHFVGWKVTDMDVTNRSATINAQYDSTAVRRYYSCSSSNNSTLSGSINVPANMDNSDDIIGYFQKRGKLNELSYYQKMNSKVTGFKAEKMTLSGLTGWKISLVEKSDSQSSDQNTNTNTKPATSNNVVSTNKSKGTATVKDAVSGGNAEVPIVYTTQGKMCRMYDPNRGEHFYTKNEAEAKYLETIGWVHESNADFTVVSASDVNAVPVYRLYNPNGAGMHFYTENAAEAIFLKSAGWNYEGISHYVYNKNSKKGVPQYRLYNPNSSIGEHNWTTNLAELNMLKSAGWKDEGICWNLV